MPQVDLETLVSACAGGGNNQKITCETLANNTSTDEKKPEHFPDFPPESFWLSKDAEFDWFDRNAFLERKQSTKGIGPGSNSSSQRFSTSSLKTKPSIIGLPKTQKPNFVDSKRRSCRPANIRLFPTKRSESTLNKAGSQTEPSSPKVSCMGRVRSKRSRRRSSEKSKKSKKSTKIEQSSFERSSSSKEKRKTGFCSRLLSIFRSGKGSKRPVRSSTEKTVKSRSENSVKPLRKSKSVSLAKTRGVPVSAEPVGLGGMKRFASSRRSESWGEDEINGVI